MEIRFEMKQFLPFLVLSLLSRTTSTNNVSTSNEIRHARVSGRIVKLYSGIKPEPILCPREGFQADPVECAVFYRCVKGSNDKYTVFRYQCGPGTVYDPDTEICNHPKSTKRVNCGGYAPSSTDTINENEIDGLRHEIPSPISTKEPTYTDQTTKKRENLVTKNPWSTPTDHKKIQSSNWSVNQWMTTHSQRLKMTSSPLIRQPTQTGEPCMSDGFMGDTENCQKFYRCVGNGRNGYIRYEFSCSELTVWDDETQACNHAWAVRNKRCGRGYLEDTDHKASSNSPINEIDTNPFKTVQLQTQISYGSKVNQVQTQISKGSVIQKQTQINYGDRLSEKPNTNFKQNQTQISDGVAISQTQTQINHGDIGSQTQLQIDHSKGSSQSQTQINEVTTVESSYSSQDDKTQKPNSENPVKANESNECAESGFMGDPNNCKKFYRCVDNGRGGYIKYEFACGEGTVWDPNAEACNHEWAVKDCMNKTPSSTMSATTIIQISQHPTITSTTIEDEDIGYGNQGQQQTSTPTNNLDKPLTTTEFSTTVKVSSTTEVSSTSSVFNESVCSSSGFMGDKADCKKFYRCVDNGKGSFTKYEYKCGEGTVWDSDIEACNHVWAVKNCGSTSELSGSDKTTVSNNAPMTTITLIQSSTEPATVDDDIGYGHQQIEPESSLPTSTTTSQRPELPNLNQDNGCVASGFMGDQKDCKKFYRCVDNGKGAYTRYDFSCGEGTVWDPQLEACNHAWAVEKCGGDKNPVETTTQAVNIIHDESFDSEYPSQSDSDKPVQSITPSTVASTSTTISQPMTSIDNMCISSGFFGDQNNCKKFYRCVDDGEGGYVHYDFTCGEGTIWDQSIESCNHPSSSNDCKSSESTTQLLQSKPSTQFPISEHSTIITTTDKNEFFYDSTSSSIQTLTTGKPRNSSCTNEGFFGDTKDCRKFYRCVDNQQGGFTKYEFACGEGTMWDPEINACNHLKSLKNGCSMSSNNIGTTQRQPVQENDVDKESSTSQISISTSTTAAPMQQENATEKCNSEGFYANLQDCSKFYRCTDDGKGGYNRYDFTCGEGTIWDQESLTCNHDSGQHKCTERPELNASEKPQSQLETTTHREISNDSTSTTRRISTDSTTSSNENQCSSEGFYANPNDCKKFYRCVSNGKQSFTKYDFTCGEGTIWVQEIQACDHDNSISNCSTQTVSSSSPSQNNYEQHQTTTAPSTTTAQSSTPEQQNDDITSDSSEMCQNEGFYPNKNDCKKFYRCVDNGRNGFTKYDFSCGDGTAWDNDIQACNHISDVKNCQDTYEQNPPPTAVNETASQTTEATDTTKTTTTVSSNENKQPSGNRNKCEQEGYFGDSSNCKKFYRCVDNGNGGLTKFDYTCGEGTIWDQDILSCNHPQDVQSPSCKSTPADQSSGVTSINTSSPSTNADSSSPSTTTQSQSSSNCSENSTQKPQNKNVNCTKAGFYANPDDCKKFYRCVDWDNNGERFSVYHFDCGEGTIWDPELETCNHEDSVYPPRDCSGTQNQSQNNSDEPTTSTATSSTSTSPTQQSTTQGSTSEETTTVTSTTNVQTTKSSTTTTETTMTQESTTTEPTTTEEVTTQQSTTQQITTAEPSTTQKATTTEKTTTQQSNTQPSSTTEESTTQQSSTTEENTTQQSSTTEESSTSEETTTQQSTTSEQTTSEQPTTNEQTTKQEETTTQKMSTTESSSETSSTEESTTQQQSTTEETTDATDSSTTAQSSPMTTEQGTETTTVESDQGSTTETSLSDSKCPETDDDQNVYVCPTSFRRHPKYCNMFYQCTEDGDSHDLKIAVFKCPNNTIYDESKTQCVEQDKADKKCDGEIAERRRVKRLGANFKEPIEVSKERHSCATSGYFPFEKSECSPAFLKCDKTKSGKMRGYIYQCPEGYIYWSISKRCEAKSSLRDCKLSGNDWSGRWDIPTERKNVAT